MCHGDGGQWSRAHTVIIIWDCAAEDYMTPRSKSNWIENDINPPQGQNCLNSFADKNILSTWNMILFSFYKLLHNRPASGQAWRLKCPGDSGADDTKMRKCNWLLPWSFEATWNKKQESISLTTVWPPAEVTTFFHSWCLTTQFSTIGRDNSALCWRVDGDTVCNADS